MLFPPVSFQNGSYCGTLRQTFDSGRHAVVSAKAGPNQVPGLLTDAGKAAAGFAGDTVTILRPASTSICSWLGHDSGEAFSARYHCGSIC